jgi:hypothetical protein
MVVAQTFVTLTPLAIVIAISPAGLLEMILVLFSRRWRVNSAVFLGSIVGLSFLTPLVVALGYTAATSDSAGSDEGIVGEIFLVIVGALFLLMALASFRRRNDHTMPSMMKGIEGMGPGAVALLSPGVTVVNPKNLAILISAGQAIGAADLPVGREVVLSAIFAVIATSLFAGVVALRLFGGSRADETMSRFKEWLIHWNQTISYVLFALLGVLFLAKGLVALV